MPKAGGTSVTMALQTLFADAVTAEGHLSAACFRDAAGRRDCLYHGHTLHGVAAHLPPGMPTATILRDPAEHAVSNYLHLLRSPELPHHRAAVDLGFSGLMRTHWPHLVFQTISLDVAISMTPIDSFQTLRMRLPAIGAFMRQIDVVGHLDRIDAFVAQAAWRTGHSAPPATARMNSAAEHGQRGRTIRRLRAEYAALADEPFPRELMRIEAALVTYARRRAAAMPRWPNLRSRWASARAHPVWQNAHQ